MDKYKYKPFDESVTQRVPKLEGNFSEFYEFKDSEDFIVKEMEFSMDNSMGKRWQKDLKNAESYLKDYIPEFNVVVSEKDDTNGGTYKGVYIFMRKVLRSEEDEASKYTSDLDNFLTNCITMYAQTYNPKTNEGPFMDVKEDNFVFGHTTKNPSPQLYFVDLYPIIHTKPEFAAQKIRRIIESYHYDFPNTSLALNKLESLI